MAYCTKRTENSPDTHCVRAIFFHWRIFMELKPTSISEQLEILSKRNISLQSGSDLILLQYGYYNLINGYKEPFIDKAKSLELGEDYYKDGTTLQHFLQLYHFDSLLRNNLLYSIVTVETQMKSLISLHFSLRYGSSHWKYLSPDSFTKDPSKKRFVIKLISKLQRDINKFNEIKKHPAICHFMNVYNQVPLWGLNTIMDFGTMSNFYDNLQDDLKKTIAKSIDPKLTPTILSSILYYLTNIRNKCAHNNRLYIHKIDQKASRTARIPKLSIHENLFIPVDEKTNLYKYGQDDALAALLCVSLLFKQNKVFSINYEKIETSMRELGDNIPNDAATFVREVTGLHEKFLRRLYEIFK